MKPMFGVVTSGGGGDMVSIRYSIHQYSIQYSFGGKLFIFIRAGDPISIIPAINEGYCFFVAILLVPFIIVTTLPVTTFTWAIWWWHSEHSTIPQWWYLDDIKYLTMFSGCDVFKPIGYSLMAFPGPGVQYSIVILVLSPVMLLYLQSQRRDPVQSCVDLPIQANQRLTFLLLIVITHLFPLLERRMFNLQLTVTDITTFLLIVDVEDCSFPCWNIPILPTLWKLLTNSHCYSGVRHSVTSLSEGYSGIHWPLLADPAFHWCGSHSVVLL